MDAAVCCYEESVNSRLGVQLEQLKRLPRVGDSDCGARFVDVCARGGGGWHYFLSHKPCEFKKNPQIIHPLGKPHPGPNTAPNIFN